MGLSVGASVGGPGAARRSGSRGDAIVTRTGLEGGPVYAIGAAIRDALDADGQCVVDVDLRPDLTVDQLAERLRPPPPEGLRLHVAAPRRRARPGRDRR